MGIWGTAPGECDEAFDVRAGVSWILDDAWALLRDGDRTLDAAEHATIDSVAGIVNAFGEAGLSLRPKDAEELSARWHEQLSDDAWDALTAEFPRKRPPFDDEREVERWLREANAPYHVWMWAAQFGDDRRAAWRACVRPPMLIAFARAAGVSNAAQCSAVARCLLAHWAPQEQEPYRAAVRVLEDVVAGRAIGPAVIDALAKRDADANDPRALLVTAADEIGLGKHRLVLEGIFRYERNLPELGALLRAELEPLLAGAL